MTAHHPLVGLLGAVQRELLDHPYSVAQDVLGSAGSMYLLRTNGMSGGVYGTGAYTLILSGRNIVGA